MAGRNEESLALYQQGLIRAQKENNEFNQFGAHQGLTYVYSEMGHIKKAQTHALEILRFYPGFTVDNWIKTQPYRYAKHNERIMIALRNAGLK